MDKIPSFQKNHDTLETGLYISTQMQGVTTFDLRFKKPNTTYLSTKACHTIEHIIATVLRNSIEKNNIIYFGPMGCRTGFYLLTVNLSFEKVKQLLIDSFILGIAFKEIPGSKKEECGNYLDHNLEDAIIEMKSYLQILKSK